MAIKDGNGDDPRKSMAIKDGNGEEISFKALSDFLLNDDYSNGPGEDFIGFGDGADLDLSGINDLTNDPILDSLHPEAAAMDNNQALIRVGNREPYLKSFLS